MTYIQMLLLIYFSLLGLMMLPAICGWKVRQAAIPLLTFAGMGLVLYLFSFFKRAAWGVQVLRNLNRLALAVCLLCLILQLCGKMKKPDSWKRLLRYFLISSLLFWCLGLFSRGWFYTEWDEFANWDSVVRSLLVYGEKNPNIAHSAYPPSISMIPFYFSALTEQNEHITILAMAVVTLAGILYGLSFFPRQRIWFYLITPLCFLFLLYILGFKINTLMSDGLIGIVFGALLIDAVYREDLSGGGWDFAVLLCWFVLMKDACWSFLLVIWGVFLLSQFFRKESSLKDWIRNSWQQLATILLLPMGFLLSWKLRCDYYQISSTERFSRIDFSRLPQIITGSDPKGSVFKNLVSFILHEPFAYAGISTSAVLLVLITLALLYSICTEDRKQRLIEGFIALGCAAYLASVFLIYLYALGDYYANTFIGFQRFMLSYYIAWAMLLLCGILKDALPAGKVAGKSVRILAVLVVMLTVSRVPLEFKFLMPGQQDPVWGKAADFEAGYGELIPQDSRIKLIFQNTDHAEVYMLENLFMGKAEIIGGQMTYGSPEDYPYFAQPGLEKQIGDPTIDELAADLVYQRADFVLIGSSDALFWKTYGALFQGFDEKEPDIYQLFQRKADGSYSRLLLETPGKE